MMVNLLWFHYQKLNLHTKENDLISITLPLMYPSMDYYNDGKFTLVSLSKVKLTCELVQQW